MNADVLKTSSLSDASNDERLRFGERASGAEMYSLMSSNAV